MPVPIAIAAASIDLSGREGDTSAVTGSPALAEEAIIATLVLPTDVAVEHGVVVIGWAAWTVGTSGVSSTLRLRQTNASGTVVKSSGALTTAAASLQAHSIVGVDASPGTHGQTYVMTLQVASGAAASTVSSVELLAFVI